jgi:hypothetical protein
MGDPPVLVASSRRARRELAWQPAHSTLERMLTDAWEWRVAHPNGYADLSRNGSEPVTPPPRIAATAS